MASLSKLLLFAIALGATAHAEIKPNQKAALDQYIAERARAPQMTPTLVAQMTTGLNTRLEALENKILPIAVVLGRAMTDLRRLMGEMDNRIVEVDTGKMSVNPYDDKGWIQLVKTDMHKVCCEIKQGIGLEKHGFGAPMKDKIKAASKVNLGGSGGSSYSPSTSESSSSSSNDTPSVYTPPLFKKNKGNKGANRANRNTGGFGAGGKRHGGKRGN